MMKYRRQRTPGGHSTGPVSLEILEARQLLSGVTALEALATMQAGGPANASVAMPLTAGIRAPAFSSAVSAEAVITGTIKVWGGNTGGQLTAPTGGDFTQIAAGFNFGLALRADGSIAAWGDDSTNEVTNAPTGTDFTAIAAGGYHGVALKSDGSLVAWGDDSAGQVSGLPGGNDFVAVSASSYWSLALRSDGSLVAWGGNTPFSQGEVLQTPTDGATVHYKAIATGDHWGLAMREDGTLKAWGDDRGQQVTNLPTGNDFAAIAAGYVHGVALRGNGSLVAWGDNSDGQTTVPTGTNFVAIAASGFFNLALRSDGTIAAWGNHDFGQTTVPSGQYDLIAAGSNNGLAIRQPHPTAITTTAGERSHVEDAGSVVIDPALTISGDATTLLGATVSITNFVAGQDVLNFTAVTGITGSFNATTGVLTFTGSATLYRYQQILRSVTFRNTSQSPDPTDRTIVFVVRDAAAQSAPATRVVTVTQVNDRPTAGPVQPLSSTPNATITINLVASDAETAFDDLVFNVPAWSAHGSLTQTGQGQYQYVPDTGYVGADTFTYTVTDTGDPAGSDANPSDLTSAPATVTIGLGTAVPLDAKGKAVYTDANDNLVTVQLSGGGTGSLYFAQSGNADPADIYLTGTTEKSTLKITVAGKGLTTTVDGITVVGGMGSIAAPTTNFIGQLTIGAAVKSTSTAALTFAQVAGASFSSVMPIGSLHVLDNADNAGAGTLVTLAVRGGGGLDSVSFAAAGAEDTAFMIDPHLAGTTEKSSLKITTGGRGSATTVGDLTIEGGMGSITGTTTNFTGLLSIGAALKSTSAVAISLGQVAEASIASVMPIKSLKAVEWRDLDDNSDVISAPWMGTITTTGRKGTLTTSALTGDFMADVTLSGATTRNVSLSSVTVAGWLDGAQISVKAGIGAVKVGGLRDSNIFSGVTDGVLGLPDPDTDFDPLATAAAIKSVTVTGKMQDPEEFYTMNSNIAAPIIGKFSFYYPAFNNSGTAWGVVMASSHVWTRTNLSYRDATGTHAWPTFASSMLDFTVLPATV